MFKTMSVHTMTAVMSLMFVTVAAVSVEKLQIHYCPPDEFADSMGHCQSCDWCRRIQPVDGDVEQVSLEHLHRQDICDRFGALCFASQMSTAVQKLEAKLEAFQTTPNSIKSADLIATRDAQKKIAGAVLIEFKSSSINSTKHSETRPRSKPAPIIAGAVSVVGLATIVSIVAVFLRRRRSAQKRRQKALLHDSLDNAKSTEEGLCDSRSSIERTRECIQDRNAGRVIAG
ncbi:hypothetical protein BOX15_Mlig005414g1 [Macrostomum lignano]|uniref:TNFR-Cys domain-containing protein n=1 Tax=Macrostomum lignano TaxID=282301 RepID=A0A267H1Q3_9PLAT|nr:hypothetical protein BOX15_Mlig005414g1 [Macrostomum lignano]